MKTEEVSKHADTPVTPCDLPSYMNTREFSFSIHRAGVLCPQVVRHCSQRRLTITTSSPLYCMAKRHYLLMFGALGSGLAGYIFSNAKLRRDLKNADSPQDAALVLGQHLQQDGADLAGEIRAYLHSPSAQKHMDEAKKYVSHAVEAAKRATKRGIRESGVANKLQKAKKPVVHALTAATHTQHKSAAPHQSHSAASTHKDSSQA